MKVGFILPLDLLEDFESLGQVHYIISDMCGEIIPNKYVDYYSRFKDSEDSIVLDCKSIDWKRRPSEIDNLVIPYWNPDIIILPSYAFNSKKTLEYQKKFIEDNDLYGTHILAFTIEGSTKDEALSYVDEALRFYGVNNLIFSIPSHMIGLLDKIEGHDIIYVDNRTEPFEIPNKSNSNILITSLPVRLGLEGRLNSNYRPHPNPLNFDCKDFTYKIVVEHNLKEVIDYYGNNELR